MHSLMSEFHSHIQELGKENNSVMEVVKSLNSVRSVFHEHMVQNFMLLKAKELLAQKCKEGVDKVMYSVQK